MKHRIFSFSLAISAALSIAACSDSMTSPSDVSNAVTDAYMSAQLEGTWTLASIQPAGGDKQERPSSATYTLTFSDSRLSTRVDCNQCAGSFSVQGTMLTAGPNLACTRAACATMTFESAYTSILNGASETVVTNSTLTLTSPRGTLQFVRN